MGGRLWMDGYMGGRVDSVIYEKNSKEMNV